MTKPRNPRSDSTTAQVLAFQRKTPNVPAHVHLRECDLPYWNAALACRNDWMAHELETLGQFAHAMADHDRLNREIDEEGAIVNGKPNLKFALAETLIRRAMSLSRHLQIHGRATRGEAREVAKKTLAPALGGKSTDLGDMDDLIPRH